MYYEFFGLNYPPYRITPDTQLFFSGGERGAILDALAYAILNGDAITKVVGEVGSGKTMLCRMLELKLSERVEIIYLANPSLSPENIPHALAFEIGLPEANEPDRLKVMRALEAYLLKRHAENRQVVVFVEEAQGMPLETLEEIRLLSNLETRQHKLLQVVLFGQPELDEGLSAPHVRQIKERIANSFHLKPLKLTDIGDYLMFRLASAGYRGPNIYHPGAIRKIARASNGLMRRINILADKAMLAAFTENSHIVTARHVSAAVRDSEFVTKTPIWHPARLTAFTLGAVSVAVGLMFVGSELATGNVEVVANSVADVQPARQQAVPAVQVFAPEVVSVVRPESEELLQARLDATQRWLADADPKHFTIQVRLARADEKSVVAQFLRQQSSQGGIEQLYVHRINVRGREMLGLLYGEYASYLEADVALRQLPQELIRYQPYLRNLHQIQAESTTASPVIVMH